MEVAIVKNYLTMDDIRELLEFIDTHMLDGIVVEGYDGVGKGYVLSKLYDYYGWVPYRPDYNKWQKLNLKPEDRWMISASFWDVYSSLEYLPESPILFDRGVISGAVYNNDRNLAETYKSFLRDNRVLHILVTTDKDSYQKFNESRGSQENNSWEDYLTYTSRYFEMFNISGVDYIVYTNHFNESEDLSEKCGGCGHYSYGVCRHPLYNNTEVDAHSDRCEYSRDKEVQDVAEMQSL